MTILEFKVIKSKIDYSKPVQYMYRYYDYLVAEGSEEYGYHSRISIGLHKFPIVKETPKGAWIELYVGKERFVKKDVHKKFACFSEWDAYLSYIERKKQQIRILKTQLQHAEEALKSIDFYRRK